MIEICKEGTRVKTSQRLADQARMIIQKKKNRLWLKILEIQKQINRERSQQYSNRENNTEKQEPLTEMNRRILLIETPKHNRRKKWSLKELRLKKDHSRTKNRKQSR